MHIGLEYLEHRIYHIGISTINKKYKIIFNNSTAINYSVIIYIILIMQ